MLDTDVKIELSIYLSTREDHHSQTTIDLVWITPGLAGALLGCQTSLGHTQGSDHLPILTKLFIVPPEAPEPALKPAWRKINHPLFLETLRGALPLPLEPSPTTGALDLQARALTAAIQGAIQTIPHQRPSQRSKSGWTLECSRAVSRAKALRRRWQNTRDPLDQQAYQQAVDTKGTLIRKTLRDSYRDKITTGCRDPRTLWKLWKWAKNRGQPAFTPAFPPLKDPNTPGLDTNNLGRKATILRDQFYPTPQDTNLEDIQGSTYPEALLPHHPVTETEATKAVFTPSQDNAPGPDKITYRALREAWPEAKGLIVELFNACLLDR